MTSTHKWWSLGAVCFGLFMALLDVTIVNVALPTIQADLHAPFSSLQWIINAYTLVFAVLLVTASRLGDIFGRKPVFILGLAIFSLGSLLCALSGHIELFGLPHITVLNIFRGLQGVGAASMMPLSLAIISATFQGHERGAAIGIWGGVSGIATAIGPLVGGFLVQHVGWESIFYLNVPIGAIGIVLSLWAISDSRDEHAPRTIDVFGVCTMTIALFCLVLALIEGNSQGWASPAILSLFAGFAVFLVVFIIGELRLKHPMVDPRMFRISGFTGSCVAVFTLSAGLYALFFFLTIYFQDYLGMDALQTGLRFLPLSALVLIGAPVSGKLTDRIGPKPLVIAAMALITLSVLLMTRMSASLSASAWLLLLPAFVIGGIGSGMVNPPVSSLAVGTVPPNRVGMASGVNNICRQIGIAFGIAFLGALLNIRYDASVRAGIAGISMHLPAGVKGAIIQGVQKAGVIVGSSGFAAGAHSNPYAHDAIFPEIQAIARAAFIDGTRTVLWVAAALLLIGLVASWLLIPSGTLHGKATQSAR